MLGINLTAFEENGEKYVFMKYSVGGTSGGLKYSANNYNLLLEDLKNVTFGLKKRHIETIVITSVVVDDKNHSKCNQMQILTFANWLKEYHFKDSEITYDTTQSLNNIQ